ncbi:hypothetical protein HWV62_37003 [Athelia sp. TMB]|nr:hypothetical protein HWV62_37003 [Athelia sp. TMB]
MSTILMDAPEKLGQYMLKVPGLTGQQAQPATSASSSSSPPSRSTTPPTEVSSRASSPNFEPPPETAESRFRRQQSDTASAEIGRRLLQGWAMLAEECPNSTCFGVPLVRPPKAGGGKDPKKECVICGIVYVSEIGQNGFEQLVPLNAPQSKSAQSLPSADLDASTLGAREKGKGKAIEPEGVNQVLSSHMSPWQDPQLRPYTLIPSPEGHSPGNIEMPVPQNMSIPALVMAATSLELSMQTLSHKMLSLSNGTMPLDLNSIGLTADAIGKVTDALAKVKQLHWSESRVGPA